MNTNKNIARTAGVIYLLFGFTGAFGILYIPTLIVPGDAAATAQNVLAAESAYRYSFVSGLLAQVLFIALLLVLYRLFKPVNQSYARFMLAFGLVSIPITMLNQLNLMGALTLISAPEYLSAFTTQQLQAVAMFLLELSDTGIFLVQIFWGLWLFPFGYLAIQSGMFPKWLGALLIVGFGAYLFDFFTYFLLPDLGLTLTEMLGLGEIVMMFYLLIVGVRETEPTAVSQPALESS